MDVNLCKDIGVSFFYIVCLYGYDSIVKILLMNGVNINLCKNDGVSFVFIVCKERYCSIV